MNDPRSRLSRLQRPKLLIRAAHHGLIDYRRDRDLRRLIGTGAPPSPDVTVRCLLSEEERMETVRCAGGADYSLSRHIEVLIALIAEARLLPENSAA